MNKKFALCFCIFLVSCTSTQINPSPTLAPPQPTLTFTSPPPTLTFTPALPTETSTPVFTPTATPFPDEITDAKGIKMRLVPAGTFTMGRENFEDGEKPIHEVYLDAYYMDVYEVTTAAYNMNIADTNHPVIMVDWDMAKTYCESRGARLPTEAEWEKAARGTDERVFPWGNTFDRTLFNFCDKNCSESWALGSVDDGYAKTSPVGTYEGGKSPYGMYDMAGNVMEWVNDWYGDTYYQSSPPSNPLGPDSGWERVLRGGSWDGGWFEGFSAYRFRFIPDDYGTNVGFRCAVSP